MILSPLYCSSSLGSKPTNLVEDYGFIIKLTYQSYGEGSLALGREAIELSALGCRNLHCCIISWTFSLPSNVLLTP